MEFIKNLKDMPNDRDFEVLFDDGTILNFNDDDFPFAEIVAWREIACPSLLTKQTTLKTTKN